MIVLWWPGRCSNASAPCGARGIAEEGKTEADEVETRFDPWLPARRGGDTRTENSRRNAAMGSSLETRIASIGIVLLLAALLAGGCGDDAGPTVPAPSPAPPPPAAETPAPPQIAAEEVVDRETLRLFVEEAIRIATAEIPSPDEAYAFFDAVFRPEGQWRHGEIYLAVSDLEDRMLFHAVSPELEGQDLSDVTDAEGVRIADGLRAAAAAGGGYVEYLWPNPAVEGDEETGSPKVTYAAFLTLGGQDFVTTSGIYPPVTAADVRNRGTLQSFVERAARVVMEGEWRHGEVYVFVETMELSSFFHAASPQVEGRDRTNSQDANGVLINQELRAAALAGGGFVEYLHNNPAVEGDEETGSHKVAYAAPLTIGSAGLFLGSGIYVEHPGEE